MNNNETLNLIGAFSNTWFSLQSYDTNKFPKMTTAININIFIKQLYADIEVFKQELISKNQATVSFAHQNNTENLFTIMQGIYPSIEEKATHLLYCFVKNQPFYVGNNIIGMILLFLVGETYE